MFILIILTQLVFFSCKKEKEKIDAEKTSDISYSSNRIIYDINFPDTVYINEVNDGIIKYKSNLDTIITTFGNKEKNRYTRFILTTTNNPDYDFNTLKQIVKDTFGALNNREIPFYGIKFPKAGTYYIDGVINDLVLINLKKKDKQGEDLARLIEDEERVTHKVTVLNKPK